MISLFLNLTKKKHYYWTRYHNYSILFVMINYIISYFANDWKWSRWMMWIIIFLRMIHLVLYETDSSFCSVLPNDKVTQYPHMRKKWQIWSDLMGEKLLNECELFTGWEKFFFVWHKQKNLLLFSSNESPRQKKIISRLTFLQKIDIK